jgi:hypothetical protein
MSMPHASIFFLDAPDASLPHCASALEPDPAPKDCLICLAACADALEAMGRHADAQQQLHEALGYATAQHGARPRLLILLDQEPSGCSAKEQKPCEPGTSQVASHVTAFAGPRSVRRYANFVVRLPLPLPYNSSSPRITRGSTSGKCS